MRDNIVNRMIVTRKGRFRLLAGAVSILAVIFIVRTGIFCQKPKCLIPDPINQFKLSEIYKDENRIFQAQYINGDLIARLMVETGINQSLSETKINEYVRTIKTLYENKTSPYPGQVSQKIVCQEGYKPIYGEKNFNGIKVTYLTGFMTGRFTFGACVDDLLTRRGIIAWFRCDKINTFNQVEFILPKNYPAVDSNLDRWFNKINCR